MSYIKNILTSIASRRRLVQDSQVPQVPQDLWESESLNLNLLQGSDPMSILKVQDRISSPSPPPPLWVGKIFC